MSLIDFVVGTIPFVLVAIIALIPITFIFANFIKQVVRQEEKSTQFKQILAQYGIKSFQPRDLSAKALDDKGYERLIGLIFAVRLPVTNDVSGLGGIGAQVAKSFQQMSSMKDLLATMGVQPQQATQNVQNVVNPEGEIKNEP